jgi:AAA family ATP:ADP antiporter
MARVPWLLRSLGVAEATPPERRATLWTAAMFCAALASTAVLRPLRDQFGVHEGVARFPYLYSLTLLVTIVFTPLFWSLADRRSSRRFVPIALQAAAGSMVLLYVGLTLVGSYDWQAPGARWVGEAFWGFFSALNAAVPSLVWIHAVEHFRPAQGKRLFGLIGVGGTLGAVLGSWLAGELVTAKLPPGAAALAAMVLLEVTFVCHRLSLPACAAMNEGAGVAHEPVARGGLFEGLRLLVRQPYLLAIGGYMMLLGMVATVFVAAQTELVGAQVGRGRDQHGWLAYQEALSQGLVLVLQVFCTGRLLRRWPSWLFLCLWPLSSVLGLGALGLWPTATAIAVVMIARRGTQYAFEKPAREVLYTPLDLATKHKVKFLLDTFAWRLGDLIGACYQFVLRGGDGTATTTTVLGGSVAIVVLWAALGFTLGRRSERRAAAA